MVFDGKSFLLPRENYDGWFLDGETCIRQSHSIDDVCALHDIDLNLPIPSKYSAMLESLGVNSNSFSPWGGLLPKHVLQTHSRAVVERANRGFAQCPREYYESTFVPGNHVLFSLEKPKIDVKKYRLWFRPRPMLHTFKPDENGYAEPVKYSRFNSRTGRLTVKSGPHILTLPKEFRGILKSRYRNGSIMVLDYVSFEAQIALSCSGRQPIKDVYAKVQKDVFRDKIPRDIVKRVTLAHMFGMGTASFAKATKLIGNDLIRSETALKMFFNDELLAKLSKPVGQKIKNYYGREVQASAKYTSTNTYIQSTAVDSALLGFSNVVKHIKKQAIEAVPLFVIHDGFVLDCSPDALKRTDELIEVGGHIQGFEGMFPLKMKVFE